MITSIKVIFLSSVIFLFAACGGGPEQKGTEVCKCYQKAGADRSAVNHCNQIVEEILDGYAGNEAAIKKFNKALSKCKAAPPTFCDCVDAADTENKGLQMICKDKFPVPTEVKALQKFERAVEECSNEFD
jgi:hypothetical protein